MRVIPSFDKLEDRHACFDLGFEAAAVKQLALEGGKETLAHGVVETVPHRAHRRPHPGLVTAFAEGERGVLGEFKRSSQHLDRGNCDDYSKAPFKLVRAGTVSVARPASR